MKSFEFATATRICFGPGTLQQVGEIAASYGSRVLVVTGANLQRAQTLIALLDQQDLALSIYPIPAEPDLDLILNGVHAAQSADIDLVISIGGGSVIDAGKAIAALVANPEDPLEYLEVVGRGSPLEEESLPFIAIPTTAGTGAEVTSNAVIQIPEHRVKVSLRSPHMLPDVAIIDPKLTYDLPAPITAATGMDALTQVIEPYVSGLSNPLTDALCRDGIRLASRSLRSAWEQGSPDARYDMALTSLYGGLALANSKLGAVHGIAGPLGGMIAAPHGAVCARLLSIVCDVNIQALRERDPESAALQRYDEIGQVLSGDPSADSATAVSELQYLSDDMQIPALSSYGLSTEDIPTLIEKAGQSSSMKGNPITLTPAELESIITQAL